MMPRLALAISDDSTGIRAARRCRLILFELPYDRDPRHDLVCAGFDRRRGLRLGSGSAIIGIGRCPRSGSVTAMTRPSRTFSAFAYVSAFVLASSMAFTRASTSGLASLKTKNSGPEISFAPTLFACSMIAPRKPGLRWSNSRTRIRRLLLALYPLTVGLAGLELRSA